MRDAMIFLGYQCPRPKCSARGWSKEACLYCGRYPEGFETLYGIRQEKAPIVSLRDLRIRWYRANVVGKTAGYTGSYADFNRWNAEEANASLGPQEVTETAERRDRKGALYIEELHDYLAANQELIAPLEPAVI
jgi:hypothetical protein